MTDKPEKIVATTRIKINGKALIKFKSIQKETGTSFADLIAILFERGLDGWDETKDGF